MYTNGVPGFGMYERGDRSCIYVSAGTNVGGRAVLFRWTFILFDGSRTASPRTVRVFARFVLKTRIANPRLRLLCSPGEDEMNNPRTVTEDAFGRDDPSSLKYGFPKDDSSIADTASVSQLARACKSDRARGISAGGGGRGGRERNAAAGVISYSRGRDRSDKSALRLLLRGRITANDSRYR